MCNADIMRVCVLLRMLHNSMEEKVEEGALMLAEWTPDLSLTVSMTSSLLPHHRMKSEDSLFFMKDSSSQCNNAQYILL